MVKQRSHAKPLSNAGKMPHGLDCGLADDQLYTRVMLAWRPVRVRDRSRLQDMLSIDLEFSAAGGFVNLTEFDVRLPPTLVWGYKQSHELAFVTAILGRMSRPDSSSFAKTSGTRWPHGSKLTMRSQLGRGSILMVLGGSVSL